jgi:bifunctional lysine-specific demethylase and histidyl-hydroxylase MINA
MDALRNAVELPLAGQGFDPAVHEQGAPTLEVELKAGDVGHIPRGIVHHARSGDNISLHITAGILRNTWGGSALGIRRGGQLA